jgi:hypothetical protein
LFAKDIENIFINDVENIEAENVFPNLFENREKEIFLQIYLKVEKQKMFL